MLTAQSGPCGSVAILACPPALGPHVEFAVSAVLGEPVTLRWTGQPAYPAMLRAALHWRGGAGRAVALTGRLRAIGPIRFEVSELASVGCDGERFSYTPELGLYRAVLSADGGTVVGEEALRDLLVRAASAPELTHGLERLLGAAWDEALEPLRRAADGEPVTLLRRTG